MSTLPSFLHTALISTSLETGLLYAFLLFVTMIIQVIRIVTYDGNPEETLEVGLTSPTGVIFIPTYYISEPDNLLVNITGVMYQVCGLMSVSVSRAQALILPDQHHLPRGYSLRS